MTIIAGFKSYEGIVVCADTQETLAPSKPSCLVLMGTIGDRKRKERHRLVSTIIGYTKYLTNNRGNDSSAAYRTENIVRPSLLSGINRFW